MLRRQHSVIHSPQTSTSSITNGSETNCRPITTHQMHSCLTVNDDVDSCTVCPVSGSAMTAVNMELMSVDYGQCLVSVSSLESSARQQEDKHTTTTATTDDDDDDDDDVSGGPVSDSVLGPAELLAHYKVTAL